MGSRGMVCSTHRHELEVSLGRVAALTEQECADLVITRPARVAVRNAEAVLGGVTEVRGYARILPIPTRGGIRIVVQAERRGAYLARVECRNDGTVRVFTGASGASGATVGEAQRILAEVAPATQL